MGLFVGSVEKDGREWTLDLFNNDALTAVVADRDFEIRQFMDEDLFAHQPIRVDSEGVLRRELFLVSRTKVYPKQAEDEDSEHAFTASLPISTPLTAEELMNPIVQAVRLPITFEEDLKLARDNPKEYKRTLGGVNASRLLVFIRPDRVEEFKAMLEEEMDSE